MNFMAAGVVSSAAAAEAFREKAYAAERCIAGIRGAVVVFNTFAFFTLVDKSLTMAGLAYGVLVIAWVYASSVWLLKPYNHLPIMLWSYLTSIIDSILVAGWILATGGLLSPYHVLWYLSLVAVAFRYGHRETVIVAVAYAAYDIWLARSLGQIPGHMAEVVVRSGYILFVGVLGGIMGRETSRQMKSRAEMREELRAVEDRLCDQERLAQQALRDVLTGLPNRTLLEIRAEQALLAPRRNDELVALLMIDLDGFKAVNDAYGHDFGDQLLQQIGQRLAAVTCDYGFVARLGGDEFAVILAAPCCESAAANVAQRILGEFKCPFMVEARRIEVSASIGIGLYPLDGPDVRSILRSADLAMYKAKRQRVGYAFYAAEEDDMLRPASHVEPFRMLNRADSLSARSQELRQHTEACVATLRSVADAEPLASALKATGCKQTPADDAYPDLRARSGVRAPSELSLGLGVQPRKNHLPCRL
jgi:diguanylate cyclase (GGDEF)-like protein